MPRSLEEVLAHADELADEFETLDPTGIEPLDVGEYLLRRAARARALAERQVADAVVEARRRDMAWRVIGNSLGTTAQSAQRRYSWLVKRSAKQTKPAAPGAALVTAARWSAPGSVMLQGPSGRRNAAAKQAPAKRAVAKRAAAKKAAKRVPGKAPAKKAGVKRIVGKAPAKKVAAKRATSRHRSA